MKELFFTILLAFFFMNVQSQREYRFIESSTDSIFYEVAGQGKGVLFLAGGPGGAPESLNPIIEYVSKNYYTLLLHQRGTGLSSNNKIDATSITLNQYISDIDNILEKENRKEVYIIGHSWGAMLGLDYMVKNPEKVKGLILIGSSGYSLDFVQSMNNETFKRMTPAEMDSIMVYAQQTYSKDPALKEEAHHKMMGLILTKQFYNPLFVSELLKSGPINSKVNEILMNDLAKNEWNLHKKLEGLDNPVIIINGSYDPIDKAYAIALKQVLKNGELHILDDCGHYVWIEKPKELQRIIEEFLSKH